MLSTTYAQMAEGFAEVMVVFFSRFFSAGQHCAEVRAVFKDYILKLRIFFCELIIISKLYS